MDNSSETKRKKLIELYNSFCENNNNRELENVNQKNMGKIYKTVINDEKLGKHINFDFTERKRFLSEFPYRNLPCVSDEVFTNVFIFHSISYVNGSFITNENLNLIDFTANYIKDDVNLSQNCLLPIVIFNKRFDYKSFIPELKNSLIESFK